jgi:hypothetical protein
MARIRPIAVPGTGPGGALDGSIEEHKNHSKINVINTSM